MAPADYDAIGFMCGLEVHQQLLTESKLFCRCKTGRRATSVDAEVLRHMRPTLSEMGFYDGCALMEFKTRKEIVYQLERGSICTYEIDDTPPFPIDDEAVRISLEISRLLGLQLVSELHVMRKQYLDGSIPTGFQRTTMVGVDGRIPFRTSELGSDCELRIRQLTLEEDSCREISDVGHRVVFCTDRLGTPLIETVTEPDLLTPKDVMSGGRLLAELVRSTGMARRGAGAARQDVNVSVAGGRRVEIKGVSRHSVLPRLVHLEAFRQLNLLRLRAELVRRGMSPDGLTVPLQADAWESDLAADVSSLIPGSAPQPIAAALARGERVIAVRLPGFTGLLEHPTQPGLPFAAELCERVRVIACLESRPFLTHDESPSSGLGQLTWRELRKAVGGKPDDAVVLVWGPGDDVDTAAREIVDRAAEAFVGVPSETRQAHPNGTTGFERILPGAERMYPDTDTPPVSIPAAWVENIDARLPERPWARVDRYRRFGIPPAAAASLAAAPWADLFDELAPAQSITARRLAFALAKRLVHFFRMQKCRELPGADRLKPLIEAVDAGRIRPEGFERLFDAMLRADDPGAAAALVESTIESASGSTALPEWIGDPRRLTPDRPASTEARLRYAMGRVMPELLGRIDPKIVAERISINLAGSLANGDQSNPTVLDGESNG